ncbi:diguanylate cyclase domain-containing protein [Halopseudomonas sp.]|uniref:diguanylate cyclase domain-containing protein n=1 Tax=Halopseudomonas sp. TaxID=2901191 RepID=UPI00312037EE
MTTTPNITHDRLLDLLLDVVCVVNKDGRFLSVSAASERVFGYLPDEMIGRTAFEFVHPDDKLATQARAARISAGEPAPDHENRYIHKNGQVVHIMWSTQWLEEEQVRVGVARDITARKLAEARQAAIYAISEAAHLSQDLPLLYQRLHELIAAQLSMSSFAVVLHDPETSQLSYPFQTAPENEPLPDALYADSLLAYVIQRHSPVRQTGSDEKHPHWLGVPLVYDTQTLGALVARNHADAPPYSPQDEEFLHFVADQLATAINRQRTHARLSFLAQHDQLTQLANRARFLDQLQSAVQRAQRNRQLLAVLYLDLDNFKQINDNHGHAVGDLVLQEAAQRLRRSVRESDCVGRLGGDEFAVLVDNISKPEDAAMVAEKILAALSAPCQLEGHTLTNTPSIGIAIYPEHGQNELHLIRRADDAMYAAKREGGRRHQFFAEESAL